MEGKNKNSVLIVEDHDINAIILEQMLSSEYTVYMANNGEDALKLVETHKPDVILLDIIMPGMDGYAVITALKKSEKTRNIPVIFITELNNFEVEEKGLSLGAADYITKPFSPVIVKLRVENQLKILEKLKELKEALHESNKTRDIMTNILNKSDAMIYVTDMTTDKILFINENMKQNFGIMELDSDVIGKDCYKIFQEGINKRCDFCPCHQLDKEPDKVIVWEKYNTMTKRFYRNSDRYVDWPGGKKVHIQHCVDITDIKETQERARDDEERMQLMLNAMPLACRLINRECKIIDFNKEAANLFEVPDKKEYLMVFEYFSPEFQPCGRLSKDLRMEYFNKAFAEGYLRFEWLHKKLNGELLPCEITLVRVRHKGEYIIAAYTRDLREQKAVIEEMRRAEIAEESNKAKSRFLATMSHEIRTPMNSIMGFAELALDTPDKSIAPQIRDYFGKIKDSTKWLLHIINDILDISKIESGKMELENAPFDLHDIIIRCQSVILQSVKEKDLDFRVYMEPLTGKRLVGDSVRLYQAFMNLLSNAVKFTNEGIVSLSTSIKSVNDSSVSLLFEIKDSGIGMSPGQVEKIFDPFIQADSSTTRKFGGTGLGLAITKNIVELMGGNLKVESSSGSGSTFSFEITFETINASDDFPAHVDLTNIEKPYFNGLILICDDNPMNQEVIREHLERVGLRPIAAENGKIGVDLVQERIHKGEKPFDLIFMDMFMPVMDGIEAATKITELNTGTPIVAMTANVMINELENYRKHGMPDYLGKPFTSQELWRVLLKYLEPIENPASKYEQDTVELHRKLRINFVKNNQTVYTEINEAVAAGDIKLAHRLAHTLKGNAGLIGKAGLQNAAARVEASLKDGTVPIPEDEANLLKTELMLVLDELKPLLAEAGGWEKPKPLSSEQILALFEELEPMLDNINPECVNLIDAIQTVPGTEELARQMEDYDFESAAVTLANIKQKWV